MILSEAARSLDLDSTTLRKQIKNGRLTAVLTDTLRGPVYVVTPEEVARYARESKGKPGRRKKA